MNKLEEFIRRVAKRGDRKCDRNENFNAEELVELLDEKEKEVQKLESEISALSKAIDSSPSLAWFDVLLQVVNMPSGIGRDGFIELVKQSVDASAEFINSELNPAAKYYGIIQEVVQTLAEDGRFDRTIVAIRDELGSDLERYTSLEWHTEVDDDLRASSIMQDEIVLIDGHYDICTWDGSVFISATEGLCGTCKDKYDADQHDFVVTKWAHLPDTGWNKE